MNHDFKLAKYALLVLALPIGLAFFSGDRFRYPCQDPANWDKDICKLPVCDVTRTCPEHIFKGQRDPRLGPPKDGQPQTTSTPAAPAAAQGANCGK
ncbi:hypothetical protein EBT25_18880 [bacterium]|jgi:hypothetical protein|nr:hypothetical protein [bacterium]